MAVSKADIQAWFAANPVATDAQIAQAMKQYGMGSAQIAQATGIDHQELQRRLSVVNNGQEFADRVYGKRAPASPGVSNNQITDRLGQNAGASDNPSMGTPDAIAYFDRYKDVADAYAKDQLTPGSFGYGVGRSDFAKTHFNKFGKAEGRTYGAAPAAPVNPSLPGLEGPLAQAASSNGVSLGNPERYDQHNPYLQQMGDSITSQVTDNLNRNIMPGIRSSAVSSGNFGGSRQGVVEANAIKDANQGLSNALTGMRFGDYNNTMSRQLQRYGQDQSYNLGLGNLQLGNKNSDQGFYTQQRGQDLQQVGLGASLFGQGNQGMLNQGQGIYNLGLTGQQAPWQSMQNFGNVSQPYTGFGSSSQNQSGSAGAGFLGGALAGSQAYNIFGGNSGPMGVQNTGGFTNTPNYLRF